AEPDQVVRHEAIGVLRGERLVRETRSRLRDRLVFLRVRAEQQVDRLLPRVPVRRRPDEREPAAGRRQPVGEREPAAHSPTFTVTGLLTIMMSPSERSFFQFAVMPTR